MFTDPPDPPCLPLPDALVTAATQYGEAFPELRDAAWQQYLAALRWQDRPPQTPRAWFTAFHQLHTLGVAPGLKR